MLLKLDREAALAADSLIAQARSAKLEVKDGK